MKKIANLTALGIFLLVFLFIGINVVPLEKWIGVSSLTITFIISLVLLLIYLIVLIVFVVLNRRKKVIEIVEFSAPNNMTPADAGYLIDAAVDDRDISALLIYWADKKYLQVKEKEDKTFSLTKIKDSDDNMKEYEKILFNAMFEKNAEIDLKDLSNIVRPVKNSITNLIKKENNQKYFNSKLSLSSMFFNLGITILLVFLSYFFGAGGTFSIICGIIIFLISTIFSNISNKVYIQKKFKAIVLYIAGLVLFLLFAILNLALSFNNIYITLLILLTTLLCLVTYILTPLIEYRNKEGIKTLGSLLGLKSYIELAEKDKMEKLVQENPALFYKVLPFAYVLNVSNDWIEKFNFIKTINKKERKDTAIAIGALAALCIFGQGIAIFGGLFGSSKSNKKNKNPKIK